MTHWFALPAELRLMILDLLVTDIRRQADLGDHRMAAYVTVCEEWRTFIEKSNFRHLVLSPDRLDGLVKSFPLCKRGLLSHLWLRIELPPYVCSMCRWPDYRRHQKTHNAVVAQAMVKLFSILSKWVVSGNAGITLEISVHSPSDSEHFFKNRRYDSFEWTRDDCLTDPVAARNFLARRDVEGTDWCHSWREGRQLPLRNWCDMHCAAKLKFFGSLLMINSKLPEAPIVTALLIRRQYNRLFSRSTMSRLLQALPRLEEINYESWIHPHPAMKENIDNVDEQIFGQELPAGLKRLSIFKDWDSIILDDSESFTNLSQSVALALVRGSKNLEHFSSCFQVEAKDFLHSPLSSKRWQWQNLKTLSLTSALMNPTERNKDIISLLRDAAASLSRMPRLKTMELWNADKGHAAVFQYEVLGDHTAITWKSSWCFHMTPELVGFWEQMASKYTRLQLTRVVCTSTLPTPDHSYGSVLEHLKLLQKILHPVSSFQIQWEAQNPQTWFT